MAASVNHSLAASSGTRADTCALIDAAGARSSNEHAPWISALTCQLARTAAMAAPELENKCLSTVDPGRVPVHGRMQSSEERCLSTVRPTVRPGLLLDREKIILRRQTRIPGKVVDNPIQVPLAQRIGRNVIERHSWNRLQ
jgi:hypothetical protein